MKKKIEYFICICVIAIVIWGIVSFIKSATSYTENTYQLSEVDGGTYAIYYTTHSRVPAENYEVITLCYGNSIYTLDRNVSSTYIEEDPYVYIKDTNLVHGDVIHAYVPKGTVRYEESVDVGR